MYISSRSNSPELVPADEGVEIGVVTGVLGCTLKLRVGDILARSMTSSHHGNGTSFSGCRMRGRLECGRSFS